MNANVKHIIGTYYQATEGDIFDGTTWYWNAKAIAQRISDSTDISLYQVAGVIAALSPNNKWQRNVTDAELVCTLFKAGGADAALNAKVCTYKPNLRKAILILDSAECKDDVVSILNGPKVIEFYNCILGEDDVCIDGHAFSIWVGERMTMKQVPNIGKKLRAQIKADYIEAANTVGIKPFEMQAITWTVWRRIHDVA